MEWPRKIQDARESGQSLFDQKSEAIMEKHWPVVQSAFKEKVGPAAQAVAQDDHKMELLFKAVYAALPFPVHLAVKEQAFIKFCFAHRDRLLPPGEAAGAAASQ